MRHRKRPQLLCLAYNNLRTVRCGPVNNAICGNARYDLQDDSFCPRGRVDSWDSFSCPAKIPGAEGIVLGLLVLEPAHTCMALQPLGIQLTALLDVVHIAVGRPLLHRLR